MSHACDMPPMPPPEYGDLPQVAVAVLARRMSEIMAIEGDYARHLDAQRGTSTRVDCDRDGCLVVRVTRTADQAQVVRAAGSYHALFYTASARRNVTAAIDICHVELAATPLALDKETAV